MKGAINKNKVVGDTIKLYLKEPLSKLIKLRKTTTSALKFEHDTSWVTFYQSLMVLINQAIKIKENRGK